MPLTRYSVWRAAAKQLEERLSATKLTYFGPVLGRVRSDHNENDDDAVDDDYGIGLLLMCAVPAGDFN